MKPAPFRYAAPASLAGALELLREENARPLAGGQSLVPLLNVRRLRPSLVVDLNPVGELSGIELGEDGTVRLGAMTRQAQLLASTVAAGDWPLLRLALSHVGHAATRSRGTVGGSVAHADPAAQLPVALTALDARFRLRAWHGERVVEAGDFFQGPGITALESDELLVGIEIPPAVPGSQMAFCEYSRTHGGFPTAGVAAVHAPGRHAAVAVLGAGPVPVRSEAAEQALLSGAGTGQVAGLVAAEVAGDHRRALIRALAQRALERVVT